MSIGGTLRNNEKLLQNLTLSIVGGIVGQSKNPILTHSENQSEFRDMLSHPKNIGDTSKDWLPLCLVVLQSNTCFDPKPQYLIQSHPFYIFRNKSIRFSFLVLRCQEIVSLSVFEMGKENVDVFLSIRQIC